VGAPHPPLPGPKAVYFKTQNTPKFRNNKNRHTQIQKKNNRNNIFKNIANKVNKVKKDADVPPMCFCLPVL
jgi:hypothetical protein